MAFNTIYYGNFNENVNNDRIDIYIKQKNFVGSPSELLLAGDPLVISYPSKDFDYQIFGCGCKINVINDSGDFYKYDSLFSTPERSNFIEIIKTPASGDASIFLFQGYILPDMYTSKLGKNIELTIPATDRLTTLDRYTPWILVDTSTYRAKEYIDGLSLVTSILYDADVTNTVKVNNTLYNINYDRDPSHDTLLNNIWLQADNFQDKDKIENDKTVLEKILQPLYSRVFYHNGAWHIERVQDLTDSRTYTVYPKETSTYKLEVPKNIIDLSCVEKKAIADTAELSFNPGFSKLIVNLKYKKPESLVENWWDDFQYYTKEVSTASLLPLPKQRRWMFSTSAANVGVPNHRPVYPFGGIDKSCFLWSKELFGGLTDEEWFDEFFSTMFLFSPKSNTTSDPTVISVKFKQGFPPTLASVLTLGASDASQNAVKFLSRFALRACDRNGNDWWIAKSNPDDTSTYWSPTVYTFDASVSWEDIKENNFILERSEQIDISAPILTDVSISYYYVKVHTNEGYWFYPFIEANPKDTWVQKTNVTPTNPQFINELYLDVYDVFHNYRTGPLHANGWYYNSFYMCWMGDFDVDVATETYPDMLEAEMANGYFYNTVSKDLHIFDTSTILYTNGIYNMDPSDYLRDIQYWRDKYIDDFMKIQNQYMNDLSQQLSYPRYVLDIDILSNDSSILSVGYLYKHDSLKYPDGTHMLFMCNGLEYNVLSNAYRLNLEEFIADDSYRLPERIGNFYYEPSAVLFEFEGVPVGDNTIDISTNMYYAIDSSEDWISWTMNSSESITINVSTNYGAERDGSVWLIPDGSYARPISINQDISTNWALDISVNGTEAFIDLTNLPSGFAIDISIYGRCTAYAYSDSYFCGNHQAYAELDVCTGQIAFCQTDQIDCGEYSDVNDNGTQTYSNVDNTDVIGMEFLGTTYYAWNDGEEMSDGYFEVSAVLHGTSTPVTFIHNYVGWYSDHAPYLLHT